jgi:hypothetical protein
MAKDDIFEFSSPLSCVLHPLNNSENIRKKDRLNNIFVTIQP